MGCPACSPPLVSGTETDGKLSGEKPRDDGTSSGAPLAVAIQWAGRVLVSFFETFGKALSWKALLALGATVNGLVWSLPEEQRADAVKASVELFAQATSQGWIPWVGWVILIPLVFVIIPYVVAAERRIKSMGEDQRRRRELDEPGRGSSTDRTRLLQEVTDRSMEDDSVEGPDVPPKEAPVGRTGDGKTPSQVAVPNRQARAKNEPSAKKGRRR